MLWPNQSLLMSAGVWRNDRVRTGKLEVALLVDKQVLRLEVTVENAVGVAPVQAFDELVGEFLWPSARSRAIHAANLDHARP